MSASEQAPNDRGSLFSVDASSDRLEETLGTERFRDRLHELMKGERESLDRIESLLQFGAEWLGVEYGYLAQIDPADGRYVITGVCGPDPDISAGDILDLSSTYCRMVIAEGKALAIENAPNQGWAGDPAYKTFGLSSYIGTKVVVGGKLYGTVCFMGRETRDEPFGESDAAALALIARAIEGELEMGPPSNLSPQGKLPFEALFEQLPYMVSLYDLDGNLLAANEQLREETGYGVEDVAEMEAPDLDASIDPKAGTPSWQEMEPGERRRVESRYRRADGSPFPVEVTLRRLDLDETELVVATAQDVSDRKRRDRQLDAIVSNTSNPIYIKDREGRYQFVNEAASALFDADPSEVLGKTDQDLFGPETAADIRAEDEHVMETGESFTNEGVRLVGGTEHVYLDNKYPYRAEEGEVIGVIGISYDITKRKEQQRKLRDAKDLLETTFDSLQEAVVVVDGSNREIILCNGATENIFGYEKEELIGVGTKKLHVDAEAYQDFRDVSERALEEEGVFKGEYRMRRKDGRIIETEHTVTPLHSEKWPGGVVSVVRDVTERKEQERRLRAIFNQTYQFTGLLEPDGTVVEANDTALEFGGLAEEDVLGKPVWETYWFQVDEETKQRLRESVRRAADGEFIRYEMEVQGAEERRIIDFSLRPIRGEDGEVTLIIPEGRDITERKRAEEDLRERETQIRGLANSIPGIIFQFYARPDGTYGLHFVSDRAETLLGISATPEGFFERFRRRVPDTYRSAFEESVDRAVEQEQPWRQEIPFDRPNGERIWLLGVSTPDRRDGELVFNGVLLDITDRKTAEQAVRQERDRFSTLFENLPTPVVRGEPDENGHLRIRGVNAAFESTFGFSRDAAEGEDIQTLIVPPDEQTNADAIRQRLLAGNPTDREVRRKTADGLRDFRVQVTVREEEGEPVEGYAIYTDITRRKKRERELAEQRALLEAQAQSTIDGLLAVDEDREVAFYNDRFLEIWEIPENALPEESAEEPLEQIFLDHAIDLIGDPEAFRREVQEHYDRPEEESRDLIQLTDGRWLDRYSAPIVGEDETHFGRLWSFRDVTDREERRRKIEALYSATNRLLRAEDREDVGSLILELIGRALGDPSVTVRFAQEEMLVPAHVSLENSDLISERSPLDIDGESKVAEAYRKGKTVAIGDSKAKDDATGQGEARSGAIVPLGEHGTISLTTPEASVPDAFELRLVEIVAAHGTAVLDRIEHEEDLREERDLLESIFETSPTAIVLFNREGDFVRASHQAEDVLGLNKEDVTDRTYDDPAWDITTPEGKPIPDEELPFAQVISAEEPIYDAEHTIVWPNGDRRLLSVSGAPLYTAEDELEGAVFHIVDITERRKVQRALRESERRFRKLFEEAPIGMARVSRRGELLETNEAFQRILGYEAKDLRGCHFETLTYEEDIGKSREEFETLVEGERSQFTIEKRYRRGDGEVFWARLTTARFEHEGEAQVIGMVEDIDDRKQYEEGLRKAKEAAEEANRMKSALLANMSHEIRTPLTSIIGFAEAIGEEIGDEEGTAGRFARLIETSGHRLMQTLDGVLNLSKLEAGEMGLSVGPVDVAREVEAMAEELGPQADKAAVALRVETAGEPVWARAADQALQIALRNLVSNAIKYAGRGGTVIVRTYEEEESVALEVEDDGIGIAPQKVEHLFEPFRQESEGRGRAYEGTGLGLTVTKKAVEQMGGSIEVETQKGEGSRFTVWLPQLEEKEGT